ncbi:hypothetical protein AVEN_205751-1 [Araneus ventricosus]|uniref:Uncharacterized protein n=1 Tax=Araneus ventricosus TaxID=182803 RepID=A0A4Y2QWW5_ARAVE|nr:hypothetical protein AVEN_205751-1 [Araneus ventricosus]
MRPRNLGSGMQFQVPSTEAWGEEWNAVSGCHIQSYGKRKFEVECSFQECHPTMRLDLEASRGLEFEVECSFNCRPTTRLGNLRWNAVSGACQPMTWEGPSGMQFQVPSDLGKRQEFEECNAFQSTASNR